MNVNCKKKKEAKKKTIIIIVSINNNDESKLKALNVTGHDLFQICRCAFATINYCSLLLFFSKGFYVGF